MIYDLALDREEFNAANALVTAVLLSGSKAEIRTPFKATSDSSILLPNDQLYVESNPSCLGVCFGHPEYLFDIWITPSYYDPATDIYRDTVLHELCHGHIAVYKHNHRWKRFFGRVLYHYGTLLHPIDYSVLTESMLNRYTVRGKDESYNKYLFRLEMEQLSIENTARQEQDKVLQIYNRIKGRTI